MGLSRKFSKRRYFKCTLVYFLTCCMFFNTSLSVVLAGPEGAQVINGQVSFQQSGYNTTITASDKSIINYSSFDISRPEIVQFIQPGSNASVLNRILSANPTNINGTLLANGRVFFVNPAGVYIGAGARVNVNQLVASGLNITNSDFINGQYNFAGGNGSVVNSGDISAKEVYLIGKQVTNSGTISCPGGYVVMASGDRVFLGEPGTDVVLEMDAPSVPESAELIEGSGVLNEGTVDAAGGTIVLAAGDIYSQAISNTGSLSASVETGDAGQIKLTATEGTVISSGSIEATSASGAGGTVQVLGDRVGLLDTAAIDVSGSDGGGTVLIGGDYQGKGEVPTASRTYISENSTITADATENGDGGKVIVWADEITGFYGNISAHGGDQGGDGGFVEVSGKGFLDFDGNVDVSSMKGTMGTILLDPRDITIEDAGSSTDDSELSDDQILFGDDKGGGATSDDFAISDTALNALSGNVILQANRDVTQNANADISLTTSGQSLTIQAGENITLNATVTTNNGDIHLEADSPHSTADTGMAPADGSGTLTVGSSVSSTGGNIALIGADFSISGTVNAGSGNVNIAQSQSNQALLLGNVTNTILTDSELDNISTTGMLTIGQATTKGTDGAGTNASTLTVGAITLEDLTQDAKDITLVSNNTINDEDDAGDAIITSGTLTLTSNGAIGGSGGPEGLNTDVGTLAVTTTGGSNVTVTEADGLDLAASTVGGTLDVTATNGAITDSGAVAVTGAASFTANGTGGGITLDLLEADSTVALDTVGNALVTNDTALDFEASTVGGTLTATATTGAITDTGAVAVTGAASFTASGAGGGIDLDLLEADSTVALDTVGNAIVTNDTGLDLAASTVDGDLDVTASAGDMTDSGTVTVGGTASFTTSNTDDDIDLDDLDVTGSIALSTTGSTGNATIVNTSGVDLAASTVNGTLDVTATDGAITDTGAVAVTGAASFMANGAGGGITLDLLEADSTVALDTVGNALVTNDTALDLAASTVGGTLDATATTGDLTFNGLVTAGGGYDIIASLGDVIFAVNGSVTGAATSSLEATAGSIANTGSDEAIIIETTGAGSNLTLTAANDSTQSTKAMTVVSGGELTVNAPLDNTSSTTTLSSADNLTINENITDATAISAHAGTDGTGDVTFGAGVTLDAPIVTLQAGDGLGGNGTTAQVDIMTNTPTVAANSALTIEQDGQIGKKDDPITVPNEDDPWNPNVTNNATIDLNLKSGDSSIYTTQADSWKSITATAENNIELQGNDNININSAGISSTSGGVKIVSIGGIISTPGAGGMLDAPITGYSDQSADIGVNWIVGSGKAAIIIQSYFDELKLGANAILTANGSYDPSADDRGSFLFNLGGAQAGEPIDVAIYLGGLLSNVEMGSGSVSIDNTDGIGTLMIDAYDTILFTSAFEDSLTDPRADNVEWLEVVSRSSPDLETVIGINPPLTLKLPHADNLDNIADGLFDGTYVLRGLFWGSTQVLGVREAVPLALPKPLEPEMQGEVEAPDMEAIAQLLADLGIGVQPFLARAYRPSLNTDLSLIKAAEKLLRLGPTLEDADGTRIAALIPLIRGISETPVPVEEQMTSFVQELARQELAGQWINALTEYAAILNNEIGLPADDSVARIMVRYGSKLTGPAESLFVEEYLAQSFID